MTDPIALGARTPRHDLPLLYPGQAQKEAFLNEALARLDALVGARAIAMRADPPTTHAAGDTFLVADPADGAWSGQEGALAMSQGTHWLFLPPQEGMCVYDEEHGALRLWRGGWSTPEAVADPDGGTTIDVEARGAIVTLLAALRGLGIIRAN